MVTGIVKWFDSRKGFGFAELDATRAQVFLHPLPKILAAVGTLAEGDRVELELEKTACGWRARRLRKLDLTSGPK